MVESYQTGTRSLSFLFLIALLLVALLTSVLLSVAIGSVSLPLTLVGNVLWHELTGLGCPGGNAVQQQIVWDFRLPRTLLALLIGGALSLAGTVLQAVVRNPLADPYVFGVSSGAGVAAVAALTLGGLSGSGSVGLAAFCGALLTTVAVYTLARKRGQLSAQRLILAGVAVGYVLSAMTSFLLMRAAGPGSPLGSVLTWLSGSVGGAKWSQLGLPALVLLGCSCWLMGRSRALNALAMGEETAVSLGVNLRAFRTEQFIVTALLVGVAVAVSGAIGFIGLMVPHVGRLLTGSDHRRLLPLSVLLGAIFMVCCDLLGRTVIAPEELPVGIVTALFGGPFFIWLLRRSRS